MVHRRDPAPSERTPEWLIGLLIAIVLVTVGWFFLRSVGAGDDPVVTDDGQTGAMQTEFVGGIAVWTNVFREGAATGSDLGDARRAAGTVAVELSVVRSRAGGRTLGDERPGSWLTTTV